MLAGLHPAFVRWPGGCVVEGISLENRFEWKKTLGDPAPYPLQYVEIGNENWGAEYDKRFDIFYKAIKEKYPQLTLISNHGLGGTGSIAKTDMIDPHWYVEPDYFYENARLFDGHPRGNYDVYVGEYACNQKVGGGNMNAALAEAAFIGGMERNGDLVKMASYAPLFENRNDRCWSTNLIWIDSDKVLGRASYYVQQMAAENRPTYNVGNDFVLSDSVPRRFVFSGYDEAAKEAVLKVVNATDTTYTVGFTLEGMADVARQGKVVTLAASGLEEENSWEEPEKIKPQECTYNKFGKQFCYTFRPYSYTVLRIKGEPLSVDK